MRRRPEAYHGTLRDEEAATIEAATGSSGQPASIHERLAMKEAGLAARLHYDAYERRSGLVRFLAPATDADGWATAEAIELGDAVDGAFEIAELGLDRLVATRTATVTTPAGPVAVDVTKTVALGGDRRAPTLTLTVAVRNRSATRDRHQDRRRVDADAPRRRCQPGGVVGGRRGRVARTTRRAARSMSRASPRATTSWASP